MIMIISLIVVTLGFCRSTTSAASGTRSQQVHVRETRMSSSRSLISLYTVLNISAYYAYYD